MTANEYMPLVVLALVIYTWGCLNRGWTSPLDVLGYTLHRAGVHRLCWPEDCRSDDDPPLDPPDDRTLSTPDPEPAPTSTARTITGGTYGPALDLAEHHRDRVQHDPASRDLHPGETRMAWTRRQLEAGILSRSEIDALGAEKFGVHPDSIRRYRRLLAKAGTDTAADDPADDEPGD